MTETTPLAPEYQFYTPPAGRRIIVGADEHEVELPQIQLPVESDGPLQEEPNDKTLGVGLYNYLRRFPDCPQARDYAQLLQKAFPYYLTDIGSQIIMLEAKDVDAPYIRRKINYLKILALLEPENPQLLYKIGMAYFELGMVYVELINIRREFSNALNYSRRALQNNPQDTSTLNLLGQISYLMGDYPAVLRYWQGVVDLLPECAAREVLQARIARVAAGDCPPAPLVDDLEAIGIATEHFAANEFDAAAEIMNRLEEEALLPVELPNPEFYYFLGICREKSGESAAAFEAFTKALEIDPEHEAAQNGIDRIQDGSA